MSCHLAILKKPYLDAILAGRKTIESRFYKTQPGWLTHVRPGDKLFLKESAGPVTAVTAVAAVKHFDNLTPRQIDNLKEQYNHHICGDDQYWQTKRNCRFGILLWLQNARPIDPVRITKTDWRAWVVLTEKENFGLLNTPSPQEAL